MDDSLAKIRHARSKKDFPFLKLEEDEYVEFAFSRAKICLIGIFGGVAVGIAAIVGIFMFFLNSSSGNAFVDGGKFSLFIIAFCFIIAALLIGVVALIVYRGNRLFITNKHAIQMVMRTPVATSVNMIDLPSIEDASFHQDGITQKLFRYGTFRLSTVGDETTYTFTYSDVTPEDLKAVSKLITEAKEKLRKDKKK